VLGTDAGMPGTPHGASTLREMELMVKAGLTPTDSLLAGTINSAKALGQGGDRGSIEVGKRADLVLIKGRPWEAISDVYKVDRTIIDGRIVYGPGSTPNPLNAALAPPAVKAVALIDDFERPDGRTALDTLRTDNPDGGLDRSVQVTEVIDRLPGHALSVEAKLSVKKDAKAAVVVPLSRGAVTPVDARAFAGLTMEIRGGKGPYRVAVLTVTLREPEARPSGVGGGRRVRRKGAAARGLDGERPAGHRDQRSRRGGLQDLVPARQPGLLLTGPSPPPTTLPGDHDEPR
jgi:hypothetical protein